MNESQEATGILIENREALLHCNSVSGVVSDLWLYTCTMYIVRELKKRAAEMIKL